MNETIVERDEKRLSTADLASDNGDRQEAGSGPLLPVDFARDLRTEWDRIQTGFVDEPRAAVQHADELVARAIQRLADGFAEARSGLERQWARGDDVSTEDLRVALQKYRSFFQRLLNV